jgi:hypothetical protein
LHFFRVRIRSRLSVQWKASLSCGVDCFPKPLVEGPSPRVPRCAPSNVVRI